MMSQQETIDPPKESEYCMPGGIFSGQRYAVLTPEMYRTIDRRTDKGLEDPVKVAFMNFNNRINPVKMRNMIDVLKETKQAIKDAGRNDTLTLVTYGDVLWPWLVGLAIDGTIDHTVLITSREHNWDEIHPLPVTEILFRVTNVQSIMLVTKFPRRINIHYSILIKPEQAHWALGALRSIGRPDIGIFIDLAAVAPDPRGASI